MSERIIRIFISHSWDYEKHYKTLSSWIFGENWSSGQARLKFEDYSVPRNDPIHTRGSDEELENRIFARIALSHVIVIPTGMYASHSKWIKKEIAGAKGYKKPILGVNPWGQERRSVFVKKAAKEIVGWNKEVVVKKIWQFYSSNQ